jgi:hypothetical protein
MLLAVKQIPFIGMSHEESKVHRNFEAETLDIAQADRYIGTLLKTNTNITKYIVL